MNSGELFSLAERERAFLYLLRRYRASTMAINTSIICGGSESSAKKLCSRLRDYVAADPFGSKTVYYRLTPTGAKLLGVPEEQGRPLGPQALPKAIGILGFCCEGSTKRTRYTKAEFIGDFPDFGKKICGREYQTDFFLDFDGTQARLGEIVVDLGGDYRKQLSKCRIKLREYLDVEHLRDIIADGLFTIAFVTAEAEKAQAIRLALAENPLRARTLVEVSNELQRCPIQIGLANA